MPMSAPLPWAVNRADPAAGADADAARTEAPALDAAAMRTVGRKASEMIQRPSQKNVAAFWRAVEAAGLPGGPAPDDGSSTKRVIAAKAATDTLAPLVHPHLLAVL